ncbi:hypothetical protein LZ30DRAFT_691981 [Colletotrichum cereale]|nr:hypothetical protein LZ30DRAFT_691981 [Colletotrichum cereale]
MFIRKLMAHRRGQPGYGRGEVDTALNPGTKELSPALRKQQHDSSSRYEANIAGLLFRTAYLRTHYVTLLRLLVTARSEDGILATGAGTGQARKLDNSEPGAHFCGNWDSANTIRYPLLDINQPSKADVPSARLAQSVERETLNLKVVGSTPTSGSIPVSD